MQNNVMILVVWLSLWSSVSRCELLVYEGFSYERESSLDGQSGGVGLDGSWRRRYSGKADLIIIAGLTFSDYPVSGNAALASAVYPGENKVNAVRPFNVTFSAAPTPVWMSYLFSYTVVPGESPAYYAGVSTANDNFPEDYHFDLQALAVSNKFGASYQSPEKSAAAGTNASSTTYLLIGKYVGGVGVTMWALTAANYDAVKTGGITEEELNATNSGKIFHAATPSKDDTLQSFLCIENATFGEDSSLKTIFDELKLGASLADVVSAPLSEKK